MNTDYQSLPRLKNSISYVYLEHSIIEQEDASIVAIQSTPHARGDEPRGSRRGRR